MQEVKKEIQLMGTVISLWIGGSRAETAVSQAIHKLFQYNQIFSANDLTSDLMILNQKAHLEPVPANEDLFKLIQTGQKQSLAHPSQLNIAIGPLVKLWQIGFTDARKPSQKEIDQALGKSNPAEIQLNPIQQTVHFNQSDMEIDLGALAKGYITDRLIDFFKDQGLNFAVVNLGGNIRTFGPAPHHQDQLWRIGLQDPQKSRHQHKLILKFKDKSIVTSGTYERIFQHQGKGYHHILDPQTGYPIQSRLHSLSIISDLSIDGEIWTSRLFGLPIEIILKEINQRPELEGIAIDYDGKLYFSNQLSTYLGGIL